MSPSSIHAMVIVGDAEGERWWVWSVVVMLVVGEGDYVSCVVESPPEDLIRLTTRDWLGRSYWSKSTSKNNTCKRSDGVTQVQRSFC